MTSQQFQRLLTLATIWVEEHENNILANGQPLTPDQQIDAYQVGVKDIRKVRVLLVKEIPTPGHPELREVVQESGLLGPKTIGISFRHGIYLRKDHGDDRELLVHELVHTYQYERSGSIHDFLKDYLFECLTEGYPNGPLEQEAKRVADEVCSGY